MSHPVHSRPAGLPERVHVRGVTIRLDWDGYHAVTRGYFPLSSTGFRSYSGLASADAALLDARAVENDRAGEALLRAVQDCRKIAPARAYETTFARFVRYTGPAERAIEAGLFATKELRGDLWGYAVRILEMIQDMPELHPRPGEKWTAQECSDRTKRLRDLIEATRLAIAGELAGLLSIPAPTFATYAALRPGEADEPKFKLPVAIVPERVAAKDTPRPAPGRDGTGQTEFGLF